MVFYSYMIEEYWVGSLDLPLFNAVSDGSMILISLNLLTAWKGNNIWKEQVLDDYNFTFSELIVYIIIGWQLLTVLSW